MKPLEGKFVVRNIHYSNMKGNKGKLSYFMELHGRTRVLYFILSTVCRYNFNQIQFGLRGILTMVSHETKLLTAKCSLLVGFQATCTQATQ
jgi:hypothetical protein